MLIRLLVGLSGPACSLGPGDERDFPQPEAIRLIEAGYAIPVERMSIETTVRPAAPELRHRLNRDGDGHPGGSLPVADRDVCDELRARYEHLSGSLADRRWGEARLRKEIAEME